MGRNPTHGRELELDDPFQPKPFYESKIFLQLINPVNAQPLDNEV